MHWLKQREYWQEFIETWPPSVNFCDSSEHIKKDLIFWKLLSVKSGWGVRESQTGRFVLVLCRLNGLQRYCNSDKSGVSLLKYTFWYRSWIILQYPLTDVLEETVFHGLPQWVCVMCNNIQNLRRFLCLHVNIMFLYTDKHKRRCRDVK